MNKKPATTKKRTSKKAVENDTLSVSNTGNQSATAVGRNSKAVVFNISGGWLVVLFILALALAGSVGYLGWRWIFPEKMTGDFRIAIAGFGDNGNSDSQTISAEIAQSVYVKIDDALSDIKADYVISIWDPEKVGKISGDTATERSESARKIAEKIDANIVIYGYVDATASIWEITPEFYIASINSFQAEEITGQYQLGRSFTLEGQENASRRLEIKEEFTSRSEVISKVTIGLLYYSLRDYKKALEIYENAENTEGWSDDQGKEVLYLLMGNAAGKDFQLEAALEYLNKSLTIDPEYARPLISIGGIYYLQALEPAKTSKNPSDIDQELLKKAVETFRLAMTAKNQPPLSDIAAKVHFGLGQCYFMQAYGGKEIDLQLVADEFQKVISEYDDGSNPRLRELAAESHARMGLLYVFSGRLDEASREYQLAANLWFDNPEKQKEYQENADKYKNQIISTP